MNLHRQKKVLMLWILKEFRVTVLNVGVGVDVVGVDEEVPAAQTET